MEGDSSSDTGSGVAGAFSLGGDRAPLKNRGANERRPGGPELSRPASPDPQCEEGSAMADAKTLVNAARPTCAGYGEVKTRFEQGRGNVTIPKYDDVRPVTWTARCAITVGGSGHVRPAMARED